MPPSPTPEELKARYPYMFSGDRGRLDLHEGRMPIFARACDDVDALLGPHRRGFHWTEIKEKLGFARFRYRIDRQGCGAPTRGNNTAAAPALPNDVSEDPVLEAISQVRRRAQDATAFACIVCGASAERVGVARLM